MANEDETVEMTEQEAEAPPKPARKPSERRDDVHDDPDITRAELERTRAALSKANKEAKEYRLRKDELERAEEERASANLTETERKAEDAQSALQRTILDAAVEREAGKMNFIYPDIAPSLIDRRRVSIDEETGKPAGIKEALERLLKDKPDLAYASPRGGTPPREGPSRRPGNSGGPRDRQPDIEAELRASGNYV